MQNAVFPFNSTPFACKMSCILLSNIEHNSWQLSKKAPSNMLLIMFQKLSCSAIWVAFASSFIMEEITVGLLEFDSGGKICNWDQSRS